MSRTTGAATAAPASINRAKARRKRKHGPTVIASTRAVAHDVDALNWIRTQARAGLPTKAIVELSRTAEDWPAPGKPLSDGSLAACFAAIHHLEAQGAAWPLRSNGGALRNEKASTRTGRRLHAINTERSAARRAGSPVVLWETAYQITKLSGLLMSVKIEDVELDEHALDTVNDLHDDMLFLQDWIEQTIGAIQARLGEQRIRDKIKGLRAKTVANRCTAEEEASARRAADRLQRKLDARLSA